jgi:hypothetical protein
MTREAFFRRMQRKTGLPFEQQVTDAGSKKHILIRSNHLFVGDRVIQTAGPSGISKHHPQSLGNHVLAGTFDPATGDLFVGWMSTIQPGRGIGTELLGLAIEAGGVAEVQSVSGELGGTNRRVYEALLRQGASPQDAVWGTPLGRSLRGMGFAQLRFDEKVLIAVFSWGGP